MTEMELMKTFGDNLKSLLDEWGYTQQELADMIGVSKATISYYIQGKRMPSLKALINIGHVLNCDVDDLIDFDDRIS